MTLWRNVSPKSNCNTFETQGRRELWYGRAERSSMFPSNETEEAS